MSTSQIGRLGSRLVKSTPPDPLDLERLRLLLSAYSEALGEAAETVRVGLGSTPSLRVKNTGTILEKLGRQGGSSLKSMQDLAGMRLVRSETRDEQDALVQRIVKLFADQRRTPRVVDRRAAPIQGYRAVHVIVFLDGFPVEIQVRARLQHEWAELFEKLADQLGRGIRYGEPPEHWLLSDPPEELSDTQKESRLKVSNGLPRLIELMISLADVIASVEQEEQSTGIVSRRRVQIAVALKEVSDILEVPEDLEPIAGRSDEPL